MCNASKSIAEQFESSTVAQLRLQHEQVERAHRERIEELKAHLASVIDRTTRIRTAYDKEKRQLLSQVCECSSDLLFTNCMPIHNTTWYHLPDNGSIM